MSLPDMDNDPALAALTARLSSEPDDVALGRVLAHVSGLSAGPPPRPSAGLAAFLAAQAPGAEAAPVVVPVRSRGAAVVGVVRRLAPAGLAAKVVLGAAGVALAGTTSLGAAALVGAGGDDVSNGRRGVQVEQPPTPATQGGAGDSREAATGAGDPTADSSRAGGSSSDAVNGGTTAGRPGGFQNPAAVDAHTDGKGRDDERAASPGGGERDPRSDQPIRPDTEGPRNGTPGEGGGNASGGKADTGKADAADDRTRPESQPPRGGESSSGRDGADGGLDETEGSAPQQQGAGSGRKGGRG